jgi:hypothetical protein
MAWPELVRKSQAKTYARIDPQKVCRFSISSLVLEYKENKHIEGGHPSLFVPLLGNKRVNVDKCHRATIPSRRLGERLLALCAVAVSLAVWLTLN